jgi:hypothetical protein
VDNAFHQRKECQWEKVLTGKVKQFWHSTADGVSILSEILDDSFFSHLQISSMLQ